MGARHFIVVGGGVVGLSVSRELALRGLGVTLLERDVVGGHTLGAATGASLGVLSSPTTAKSPFQRLRVLGHQAYPALARALQEETGLDIGYQVPGSLHLQTTLPPVSVREKVERRYRVPGIEARWVNEDELRELLPELAREAEPVFRGALYLSGEAIVHPPDLVRALHLACKRAGVHIRERVGEVKLRLQKEAAVELESGETVAGSSMVLTAGAWSSRLVEARLDHDFAVRPIRGQAIEIRSTRSVGPNLRFRAHGAETEYHVIAKGGGRAWVGSTVEDVGFDARVTEAGVQELLRAARTVLPDLQASDLLESRVGLRPQAQRPGGPFLGPLPGYKGVWVACGHYRSGIHTGPISASLLVRKILGEEPPLDLDSFGVGSS